MIGRVADSADFRLGRALFGNTIGLYRNFAGAYAVGSSRWLSGFKAGEADPTAAALLRLGCARAPFRLDADLMQRVRDRFAAAMADDEHSYRVVKHGRPGFTRKLKDPLTSVPELAALFDRRVQTVLEQYYGSHIRVLFISAWRNQHIPPELAQQSEWFSNRWHFDRATAAWMKVFVNISDVALEDGPFHALTRPHSRALIARGYRSRNEYQVPLEQIEDPDHLLRASGPSGSVAFCNTPRCLHRAGLPEPGHQRDMVQFQVMPSRVPLSADWPDQMGLKNSQSRLAPEDD